MAGVYTNSELYKKAENIGADIRNAIVGLFSGGAEPASSPATPASSENASPTSTAFGGKSVVDYITNLFSGSNAENDIKKAFGMDPTGAYEVGTNFGAGVTTAATPAPLATTAPTPVTTPVSPPAVPTNQGASPPKTGVTSPVAVTQQPIGVEPPSLDMTVPPPAGTGWIRDEATGKVTIVGAPAAAKAGYGADPTGERAIQNWAESVRNTIEEKSRGRGLSKGELAALEKVGAVLQDFYGTNATKGAQFEETARHNKATEKYQEGLLNVHATTAKAHEQNTKLLVEKWGFEKEHLKRFPPGAVTEAIKKATDETTGEFKPGVMRSILAELDTFYNRSAAETAKKAGQPQLDIKLLNDKKYFK